MNRVGWRTGVVVAVVLVVVAVAGRPDHRPDGLDARVFCEREYGKMGNAAEFSGQSETGRYPRFTARGWAVSSDGGGTVVRDFYVCSVEHDPSTGEWILVELRIGRRPS